MDDAKPSGLDVSDSLQGQGESDRNWMLNCATPTRPCEALGDTSEFPPQRTAPLAETYFVWVGILDCLIEMHDKEFGMSKI